MIIAYWIVAGLLAVFNLYAGGVKLIRSKAQLAPMMGWVDTVPMWLVRVIGGLEVAGAIGLVLPRLTGIAPGLAVAAAIGFLVLQVLAAGLHLSRGESKLIGLNLGVIVLAGLAVWLGVATG